MNIQTTNYRLQTAFVALAILLLPFVAFAQGLVPCGPGTPTECQFCHFFVLFQNIVEFLLVRIVPPVAILMVAISGFMFMSAYFGVVAKGGEGGPTLLTKAKQTLFYTIIGLIVIYASWILINLFFQVIEVQEFSGFNLRERWWRIDCPIR